MATTARNYVGRRWQSQLVRPDAVAATNSQLRERTDSLDRIPTLSLRKSSVVQADHDGELVSAR